ncbi:OLC1v1024957C1 [Oldenlandia corymbosa var. corymbosa]|uniref:OLC1v1024957C1 n=1 Tax=Oldenlandia corymbosa var. corymbosa TaxID=529605 RepID=A0AAV1C3K0_OLDCO|nr:OLC1v1024957C1 [Oldenlandia corymbosa var. corymbosa]
MSSKLKKAIGAVKDQTSISLAKVASNNTSNLEVAVLKATTHDDLPIEERYVYEILQLVSSNKAYAAACARALGKRIGRTRNWIVALKSLMLVLRIFQDGDPYFPREILHAMKRGAKILNLSSFRDDSNSSPWDFTAFVRTFALYLDERLDCFLTGKLQRRYTHKVREASGHRNRRSNEPVRDMKPTMLLDRISYWQRLLERAIATKPTGAAKTNRLVQICLYAIVQESFDLYKDISDGLALLLDSFFHLQYQNCVSAFQTCVKASKLFEELSAFYALCKSIGVGRTSEYPSVQTISEELIETLQEFLKDQSSFPATTKSPNRLLLMPAPPDPDPTSKSRNESYGGLSEFSLATTEYSERSSEFGSQCTSLEDLISATEKAGTHPSISIDLEDYSDQFEKQLNRDKSFRLSDSGSTHSLPVSSSMADFVSLDDWPEGDEEETENQQQQQQPEQGIQQQEVEPSSSSSAKGWELVLAEVITATTTTTKPLSPGDASGFNAFQEQDQQQEFQPTGWEVAIVSATPNPPQPSQPKNEEPFSSSILDSLYSQSSIRTTTSSSSAPPNHYNPFLQDADEVSPVPFTGLTNATTTATTQVDFQFGFPVDHGFSTSPGGGGGFQAFEPTFQATPPTFSAQNPSGSTIVPQVENDPFADLFASTNVNLTSSGSMDQQNLVQEQQLWLQNQNKIIAKYMA